MFGILEKAKKKIVNRTSSHAMRIFSPTRHRIIMCRYDTTKVWTVPSVIVRPGADAHTEMTDYLFNNFKGFNDIISILNVAHDTRTILVNGGYDELTTFLYDVEVDGCVTPSVFPPFDTVRWAPIAMIQNEKQINNTTLAVRNMMEQEK